MIYCLIFFFPPLIGFTGGMYIQYGCLYFPPFLLLDTLVFCQPSESEAAERFMSYNDVEDRSYAKQGCFLRICAFFQVIKMEVVHAHTQTHP